MNKLLNLIFGDPNKKVLAGLRKEAEKVLEYEKEVSTLGDEALAKKTVEFKERLAKGETLEDITYEAFAVAREAGKRTLGQRYYDVQVMGGLVLSRGMIAEMRTGEGKTLTSTAPIYLNALSGKGVHVVTVNDYLAKRDAVWMGQIFSFLGVTIGVIQHESGYVYDPSYKADAQDEKTQDELGSFKVEMDFLRPVSRKEAYAADITYGTNNEFGFDYLRDNMALHPDNVVQRGLNFAIIDEVDSILIDEARTPLIISGPAEESNELYDRFAGIVKDLKVDEDYNLDEKMRVATFTESGLKKVEERLGIENLYASDAGLAHIHHAEQALKAHALFAINKEYVVQDGAVKIVDEFTGRILEGRRYSDGLHQAIEAKEGVPIQRESMTLATITFQNYFRLYAKIAGMTGTAATEAEEFSKIYNLEVVEIPTNNPIRRVDAVDRIYKSEKGKWLAIVDEIREKYERGQPVLVGTVSIEKNELLHDLLISSGIPHQMLNAKKHEEEGQVVAQAGRKGAVTIATNMAGRGVDIKLGGVPSTEAEQEEVRALGGLHVIGTERHESRRIDNQLRGRSGRQGDPGSTVFFVSLEDDLMRIFGADRVRGMMNALQLDEKTPIESKMISKALEKAQQRVEGHHFDSRKHVLEYDDVLNKHRLAIYERRHALLFGDTDPIEELKKLIEAEAERVALFHTGEAIDLPRGFAEEKSDADTDTKEIVEVFKTIAPTTPEFDALASDRLGNPSRDKERLARDRDEVIRAFTTMIDAQLARVIESGLPKERASEVLRVVMLRIIDRAFIRHLETMRHLRRGIGLSGYGQRDPLVEYKRESYGIFNALIANIEHDIVYSGFRALESAVKTHAMITNAPSVLERAGVQLSGAVKTSDKPQENAQIQNSNETAGRNEPCPCGSGKKYKKCHGA